MNLLRIRGLADDLDRQEVLGGSVLLVALREPRHLCL